MFFEMSKVIDNIKVCDNYFLLRIYNPRINFDFFPGQFLEIKISKSCNAFFKRPFAIFDLERDSFSVLYHVIGEGTKALTDYKSGDLLEILYPLGNYYPFEKAYSYDNIFIVVGGIGFASVYFLIKRLLKVSGKKVFVILGFKTKKDVFCLQFISDLKKIYSNLEFIVATDDGTLGMSGNVIDVFNEISKDLDNIIIFSCGPKKMLQNLSKNIAMSSKNICCYASFETIMGCGIGICNGCSIKIRNNDTYLFKKVCQDGPIFNLRDVLWD